MNNVYNFIKRNYDMVDNILRENEWSMCEITTILDCILNEKFETINNIVDLLDNKNLDNLVDLLSHELHIGGRKKIELNYIVIYAIKS